ncbi:HEPN domain-containing protein [Aliarcobacter butzleri]|uniref:HEPN domain-containing protein n=1 Tax=Aliarcobacter butzleri TaxID=28197 RepID=UPI002B253617|nr:HEPN domain-containing protein [Aliarcobacter butzleri]
MDSNKILKNRHARKSRNYRPIQAFNDLVSSTGSAIEELEQLGATKETKEVLLKSYIINIVTALEVYYRDMVDLFFRTCNPEVFQDKLKRLHEKTYKIDDLINLYVNNIHPLELITDNLNLQNINNIDKTFTILIGKPFLKEIKEIKWRIKDLSETESQITDNMMKGLSEIIEERHSLIHNPHSKLLLSEESILKNIDSIYGIILASDLVLTKFINENLDLELLSKKNNKEKIK